MRPGKPDLSRRDVFTAGWLAEPSSRWALGLFVADGNLCQPPCTARGYASSLRVTMRLQRRDRDGVVAFAAAIGLPTARVVNYVTAAGHPMSAVSFQSPRVRRLLDLGFAAGSKIGVVQAPPALVTDAEFWRGVIDGDGYSSISGRSLHLGLRNDSLPLLEQFRAFCEAEGWTARIYSPGKGGRVVLQGESAIGAIEGLYLAASPTIRRKREKALALSSDWHDRRS